MIEEQLKRIADALEKQAAIMEVSGNPVMGIPEGAVTHDVLLIDQKLPKATKKKTGRKPKGKNAYVAPQIAEPEPEDMEVTRHDVEEELRLLVRTKDALTAKGVLEEFGANRISDLSESDYGGFIVAAKKACDAG